MEMQVREGKIKLKTSGIITLGNAGT